MTTTVLRDSHPTSTATRRWGTWCLVAGLVGMLQGALLLGWPEQVPDERFSFPMTASWYVVAQATFFVQHLPLAGAVLALAAVPAVRQSRVARGALLAAGVGLVLLAVMEIVAMAAATTALDSTLGATINALYGPPVLLIGAGLTVGGIAGLRSGSVPRATAWLLTVPGAWVVAGLTPALASGDFVLGRVAIIVWMGMFAGLGWTMLRSGSRDNG